VTCSVTVIAYDAVISIHPGGDRMDDRQNEQQAADAFVSKVPPPVQASLSSDREPPMWPNWPGRSARAMKISGRLMLGLSLRKLAKLAAWALGLAAVVAAFWFCFALLAFAPDHPGNPAVRSRDISKRCRVLGPE
jgi:hypothetical protein